MESALPLQACTAVQPAQRLSPALQDAILQRIANGASPVAAAMAAGIPDRTWQHWMAIANGKVTHHSDGSLVSEHLRTFLAPLAERIARTVADTEARMAENMLQAGFTVGRSGVPEWRAHLELLKHSEQWRERWYERRELRVAQQGTISVEHRMVQELPIADVLELAGPEFAELVPRPDAE
jgi:hypothetical protein